ncbi:DUF6316 family protein [Aliikangiella sp. IMCC44653]
MRKEDTQPNHYLRKERIYQRASGWYFLVRQGASFGPYQSKQNAEKSLQSFVALLQLQYPNDRHHSTSAS